MFNAKDSVETKCRNLIVTFWHAFPVLFPNRCIGYSSKQDFFSSSCFQILAFAGYVVAIFMFYSLAPFVLKVSFLLLNNFYAIIFFRWITFQLGLVTEWVLKQCVLHIYFLVRLGDENKNLLFNIQVLVTRSLRVFLLNFFFVI